MSVEDVTNRQLELMKRSVDYCELDLDNMQVVTWVTDWGIDVEQRFDIEVSIKTDQRGNPILNVEVSEDGWASTYHGEDAGEASYEAYREARQYAHEKTRTIFDSIPTMPEVQAQNAE